MTYELKSFESMEELTEYLNNMPTSGSQIVSILPETYYGTTTKFHLVRII